MNKTYIKFYLFLIISLILTFFGAFVGEELYGNYSTATFICSFIILIIFCFSKGLLKKIFFYIFSFLGGFLLGPVLKHYTDVSLYLCFGITVVVVILFSIIGYKAKNLGRLWRILFSSLLVVLIYSFFNIYISTPFISIFGVILFCGWIAYDINYFKIRADNYNMSNNEILDCVMDIYLDIINIFDFLFDLIND